MSGIHRLFGNNLSVVKDATLTPSSVKTSSDVFATETKRVGSGTAMLLGNFTGIDDAIFELRVASGEGAGRITHPVFIGVGTGILSSIEISDVANQDFTIQLDDLGIDTLNAEFDFGNVVLRALVSGVVGNAISISVDTSELIFTETTFALLEEVSEGTIEFKGPQWDWNTAVLNSKGEIPVESMRLKFENDPQIYRQYKIRVASDWVYYLSPGAVRTIPIGSKVYEVTGHRRVIITDGVDIEQYTHVETLYDFVSQVREDSLLVEAVGIIADDKTPGGMNCQDFPFVTDAYMHPIKMEGSKYVQRLGDIGLQEATNTEILEIECIGNAEMGNEAWSVKGSVTGDLPGVRTAEPYIYGPVHFEIPSMLIEYQEPIGGIGFEVDYTSREETELKPPICLERRVLGVMAQTKTVTFTWTQNVSMEGCECTNALINGFPSASCLGLDELPGGGADILDLEYKNRLEEVYSYIEEYTKNNTYFLRTTPFVEGVPGVVGQPAVPPVPSTTASSGSTVQTGGGTNWKLTYGQTNNYYKNPAGCVGPPSWYKGYLREERFETEAQGQARISYLQGISSQCTSSSSHSGVAVYLKKTFASFVLVSNVVPPVNTATPAIPSASGSLGSPEVIAISAVPEVPKTQYIGGAELDLEFMHGAVAILLNTLARIYTFSDALVLWDSLWVDIKADLDLLCDFGTCDPDDIDGVRHIREYSARYLERYQSEADTVLLEAGILPGGGLGIVSACWSERSDARYWKASDGYLPAYNNVVYHGAKLNADGDPYSTKEFAFAIICACPDQLKLGDRVTVSIDSQGSIINTYQLGDKFSIPIIGAKDLELSGGIDGDDTHTWKVIGSVSGQLPDYLSVVGAEAAYNQSGLQFLIERGGIPFELGDQWTFSVEGGKFRWKKDSGIWSGDLDIGSQALSDGISVMFTDGPAPSFEAGDTFKFKVSQPNSAEHTKYPTAERWAWIGSSGTLTIDCGGAVSVSEIFVADHNIPSTATILIEGSQDGFLSTDWSEAMGWNEAVLTKVLAASATVTHLRLKITNADGCYIGWICAGLGLSTNLFPALSLSRKYASIIGGSELAGSSIPMGVGWGGQLNWENSITQSELLQLIVLLDHLKKNNNEPIILLPHILHEEEGKLCRIDTEAVEITDTFDYQPDDKAKRIQSVTIPLEPVYL
jgi:hypothetical protein